MKQHHATIIIILLILFLLTSSCTNMEGIQWKPGGKTLGETTSDKDNIFNNGMNNGSTSPLDKFMSKYEPPIKVTYAREANIAARFPEGMSYTQNVWFDDYESQLGIIIDTIWEAEGVENYTTKLNLSIASNNLPDIFKVKTPAQLQKLVETDRIENLTKVYEEYASSFIKENLASDGGLALSQCSFQGRLMALPTGPLTPKGMEYLYIRDDWRKELGLPEPNTMEDALNIIQAFAAQDPDNNGRKDTYGLGVSNKPYERYMGIKGFCNGYGAYPTQWIEQDGELIYGSVQPEMKRALENLHKLYQESLIDRNFITKSPSNASQEAVNGKIGALFGEFWVISWPLSRGYDRDNTVDWTGYSIPFAENVQDKGVGATTRISDVYVVRKGFKYPEALLKLHNYYMEKVYRDDSEYEKYRGTGEYEVFSWAAVGGGIGDNNRVQNIQVTKAIDNNNTDYLETEEQRQTWRLVKEYLNGNKDNANWVAYKYFYGPKSIFGRENYYWENDLIRSDLFYGPDTREMMRRMPILVSIEEEMVLKIITGEKPLEYFDEFVEQWYKLGGKTITYEVNRWYRRLK